MSHNSKHTPGPWYRNGHMISVNPNSSICVMIEFDSFGSTQPAHNCEANARLICAAPKLLAYAECEAAIACGKADPRYDYKTVLRSHGWNEETESASLFLSRIRRAAIEAATGSYLGRAA